MFDCLNCIWFMDLVVVVDLSSGLVWVFWGWVFVVLDGWLI